MRSSFIASLPFAVLVSANLSCQPKTATKTVYENILETNAVDGVKGNAISTPEACSRPTITTTKVERITVTVEPYKNSIQTIDVTSTSTLHLTTTITVRPSKTSSPSPWAGTGGIYQSPTRGPAPTISSMASTQDFVLIDSAVSTTGEAVTPTLSSIKPSISTSTPASGSGLLGEASSPVKSVDALAAGSKSGEATFYGGNVDGGMCSFTGYTIPNTLFGTALSDSNWAGAQACGQCVKVTGPSGTQITAMVVDQCPGCGANHLDLFRDAFAKLADPSKGVIQVSWDFVPCGITNPITLKNKSGTSKHWFSMQVVNANVGVAKLEVSTDSGTTWKATTRQPYNFFENSSGFGTDTVDVKITSINGGSIVVKSVSVAAGSTKTAAGNF